MLQVMSGMLQVGIIGSSGNAMDSPYLSKEAWQITKERLLKLLRTFEGKFGETYLKLVSGGSSWADHMAVELFLENPGRWAGLILFLPSDLEAEQPNNTARLLIERHRRFSSVLYGDENKSLEDLRNLGKCKKVTTFVDPGGFKSRNCLIAGRVDILIALTARNEITTGTADTWKKFCASRPNQKYRLTESPRRMQFDRYHFVFGQVEAAQAAQVEAAQVEAAQVEASQVEGYLGRGKRPVDQ